MHHRFGAHGLLFALLAVGCGGGGGAGSPDGGAGGAGGAGGTGPRECSPGVTQVCVGPGACAGGQHCLADGSGWSPCDCGGGGAAGGGAGTTGNGGTTGTAGSVGPTGSAGTSGAAGAAGTNGTAGAAGTSGGAGSTGLAGVSGAAGAAGSTGAAGAAGAAGAGNAGTTGSAGRGGTTGAAGAAGAGGATGNAGAGGSGGCGALIDNMEAGTGLACKDNVRDGYWFSYRDNASTLSPTEAQPPPSIVSPPRGSSQRALRTYGTFVDYAGVGCRLQGVAMNTFNAHAYSGIQFYTKGTATALKVIVQTAATESTTHGGLCTLPALSCAGNEAPVGSLSATDWRLVQIPFSSLANGTATFNRMEIWSIEFQPGAGAFDFWIDDLSFY